MTPLLSCCCRCWCWCCWLLQLAAAALLLYCARRGKSSRGAYVGWERPLLSSPSVPDGAFDARGHSKGGGGAHVNPQRCREGLFFVISRLLGGTTCSDGRGSSIDGNMFSKAGAAVEEVPRFSLTHLGPSGEWLCALLKSET